MPVSKLGVEQGLSNGTIRSIYKDKRGFMWLGTLDGLNRFDGYDFKVYQNKFGDTTSLNSNVIYGITEDKQENLWLATRLGVCRLNRLKDNFTTIYYQRNIKSKLVKLDREVIKTVSCDSKNNILIATELQGLMLCANASELALQISLPDNVGKSVYQYGVQAISYDHNGRTLIFVQDKGLFVLNYEKLTLELLNSEIKYVNSLLADKKFLWMATNDGVFQYDMTLNKVYNISTFGASGLKSNMAMALACDGNDYLYIATMGGGLSIYNKVLKTFSYIDGGDGRNDLSSSGIYSLYADANGRLWVGTRRGGINIINTLGERFKTFGHEPGNNNSLSGNFITSLCELPNGNLLIGTEDNGLNVFDNKTNSFKSYKYNASDPSSISSNNVNNILSDFMGNVWIATYTNGICRFTPQNGNFVRYKTVNERTGVENKVFNNFYEDAEKNLWASALRRGNYFGALYRYNRTKDVFEIFDDKLSDLFSLFEDKQGVFWGGGLTELVLIDRANRNHQFFYIGQFIRSITEDNKGNLWLGTEGGGLVLFDRISKKVIARYTNSQGLSNNSIFSTILDDNGNLWLGTFNGLSKFNIKDRTFKNYFRSDGLESDQFHFNAAIKLKNGSFAFGGIKGYNIFFPDSIGVIDVNAPLVFTAINVDGKSIESRPDFITKTTAGSVSAITVPFKNAVLTFNFATLDYSSANKILYAYYMEGWDKGWNYTDNIHTASYTHLREGNYKFLVKSTNGDGLWKNEVSMNVIVLPPWYRSWWAYMFYFIAAGSLIYIYVRYKSNQSKLQYEVGIQKITLQREKAEREKGEAELAREKAENERHAAELETEKTQRALEKAEREAEKAIADKEIELSEKRAAFFTNISHEFRTPLSLIINPIKDILENVDLVNEKRDKELKIVYLNARRMLSLTNQLLMFRREESGLDDVAPVPLDLISLSHDVFLCFTQQANTKKIDYQFHSSKTELEIYADKDKLEIILYNLLSNAMKYAPKSGKVLLKIDDDENGVDIQVIDNGPGISPSHINNVFDKFYQAKDSDKELLPGFGIGLYLVKQFTQAHLGNVEYSTTDGGGATFNIRLVKGDSHFTKQQLQVKVKAGNSVMQELLSNSVKEDSKDGELVNEVATETRNLVASEKKTVLVIDDDASIREYLTMVFVNTFQVYEAPDATLGISIAEKIVPDIIITDIMMAGISGIELCHKIKTHSFLSHVPVILLTASDNEAVRLEGIKEGADDYLTKPFNKEILIARVTSLINTRNNFQRYFYNEITLSNQDVKIPEQYRQFLENCIQIIENNLDEEEFNSKKLAAGLGMSYSSITKKIKAISGYSLNSFIRFIRLRKAAQLFIDTDYNVNEVASIIGIFDTKYFREQFSKQFSMNPSEFIKKYRKPFANRYTVNKDILGKRKE